MPNREMNKKVIEMSKDISLFKFDCINITQMSPYSLD